MKNQLTAAIVFYFKGEKFDFSAEIDVDKWLREHSGDMEYVYDVIALANGLDRYRYEYDVMVMEPVVFLKGTGLAARYIKDGQFDLDNFQVAYEVDKTMSLLRPIAKQYFDIDKLENHPKVLNALLAAYRAKPSIANM
ncbi:MAG: hypothetical protein Q9M18_00015 [Mariprofundaceae bacterium]|nr:hypothetical protein [Mariprofundaceae bacterium]